MEETIYKPPTLKRYNSLECHCENIYVHRRKNMSENINKNIKNYVVCDICSERSFTRASRNGNFMSTDGK